MKELPLTQGKVALVDDADFEAVGDRKWYACRNRNCWYAQREERYGSRDSRRIVRLHNVLMGDPPFPGLHVDHINGDGLDNRRENLRWVTHSQNGMNRRDARGSSQYRGVRRAGQRWQAAIRKDGKARHLGRFNTEEEAAEAWDVAALAIYGEYAALNFPAGRGEHG